MKHLCSIVIEKVIMLSISAVMNAVTEGGKEEAVHGICFSALGWQLA